MLKQVDQQSLDLVQVKAHDISAFAASKAFYGGIFVDLIMQACHWEAHNTSIIFYLKTLLGHITTTICTFYFLKERTYLKHQTCCSLFLVKTKYPTMLKQADQQSLDLVQVKADDIRAFAASKVFYGGIFVFQIMQTCHQEAHNTFIIFCLKTLLGHIATTTCTWF